MKHALLWLASITAVLVAACKTVRVSGYDPEQNEAVKAGGACEPFAVSASTQARKPAANPPLTREQQAILYYSDLGPESVEVSAYPPERREDYKVYARVCSQCHTLARSINAPTVSRGYWTFYLWNMRARSALNAKTQISSLEAEQVLDFLAYDAQERKVKRKKEFDAQTEALKCRFQELVNERIREINESGQRLLPRESP